MDSGFVTRSRMSASYSQDAGGNQPSSIDIGPQQGILLSWGRTGLAKIMRSDDHPGDSVCLFTLLVGDDG